MILAGTDADALLGTFGVAETDMCAAVCDTVDQVSADQERVFCDLAQTLADATQTFQVDTADHAAGGNIEMSTFPIMKETDETCCQILRELLNIVLETSRSVQRIFQRQSSDRDELMVKYSWLLQSMDELWQAYCSGIQKLVDEICVYEKQVLELANAQGRIPDMFCSATLRTLYRRLVESKIHVTHRTIALVRQVLDSPVDLLDPLASGAEWRVSLTRFLAADQAFQKALGGTTKDPQPPHVDGAIEQTLEELQEWTQTVHQPTVDKINVVHLQRMDK
jgi:Mg2+ and Co2+ transporter CorA